MMDFFDNFSMTHWTWFIIAMILLGLEMAIPGVVFMWIAIASLVIGAIVFFMPHLGWELQFIIFAILSIVSVAGGRIFIKKNPIQSDDQTLNQRGNQHIGHVYNLIRDMENGKSKIRIGDSNWSVEGDFDAKEGDKVKVVGVDVTLLIVEKV
ncbi:MAG: NfeD family protein [Emcibacter sp.]|nr:NfeD family protein [Emcibacter sp.]